MKKSVSILFVIALLLIAIAPMRSSAQEPDPEPGPNAAGWLPEPNELGADWIASDTVSPTLIIRYSFEMSPDVFREGAARVYAGPEGTRIILVSLLISENRVAVRRSWEEATEFVDSVGSRVTYDYDRRRVLDSMEPPPSCLEAKREEGVEDFYLIPVGATMCATDPDGILIAIVSGTFNGQSGVAASDALVSMMAGGSAPEEEE